MSASLATDFLRLYFDAAGLDDPYGGTWKSTRWLGVPVHKPPTDLLTYQQLIHAIRPHWIIETGTRWGGSALFFASICDLIGEGLVVTIDTVAELHRPVHERILYLSGDSVDPTMVGCVRDLIADEPGPVLVSLDSDHHAAHVTAELDAYAPLVTAGSWLVVEDTILGGHPVWPAYGAGPAEALAAWLPHHLDFAPDGECERHLGLTFAPGGWLRRLA